MGVVIRETGISTDVTLHDSIEHAVRAGSACIDAAGIDRNDIGLVINVGIYRTDNIIEPANASYKYLLEAPNSVHVCQKKILEETPPNNNDEWESLRQNYYARSRV